MSEKTKLDPVIPRDLQALDAHRQRLIDALANDDVPGKVNKHGQTWLAVKAFILHLQEMEMLTLRNRAIDYGQTQAARGALDALDSLLQFGEGQP